MMFRIHVPLILVVLLIQVYRSEKWYCAESVKSAVRVTSCPTSKEMWELAARKKHCIKHALRQNCTNVDNFVYHCVINQFQNETLEVCAPRRLIFGHCTEFNIFGGLIQGHYGYECNQTAAFPDCNGLYYSSDAYKYPGCYQLVYKLYTTPSPFKIDERISVNDIIPSAYITVLILGICLVAILIYCKARHLCSKRDKETKKTEEGVLFLEEKGLLASKDHVVEKHVLNTRDTERLTTTDRLGYALYITEEDFREENKEESNRYLRYYKTIDTYFVETHTYIEAENTFGKHGIVILTGPPGCGKTLAAIHLIRKSIRKTNWTFRRIQCWEELCHIDTNEKSLIFIDNIFFPTRMKERIESWWDMLQMVNDRYHTVNAKYTGSYRIGIIMTARSKVIARACSYMGEVIPIIQEQFCVDTSRLTELEKDEILEEQIAFARKEKLISIQKLDASFRKSVISSEGPIGFPLCAHLYFCGKEFRRSGRLFFSRPIEYLKHLIKDEVNNDKTNRTKSLFLILFFCKWYSKTVRFYISSIKSESICKQLLNKISPDLLANFDPLDFRELECTAQRFLDVLVKDVGGNTYEFVHDSVYEAVGVYFCETYVTETSMYFPLDIIQHQNYEKLTSEQTITLVTRLIYEALDKRLSEVFSCKIFKNPLFAKQFYLQLMKKDMKTIDHFISVANESSDVKLPCMFWACCNNLTLLTELFFETVNKRNISPSYNLYVSLYGICCAKHPGLLQTTYDFNLRNLEDMKKRVLNYQDAEDNSIIHILMSSTFSDRFSSVAIEELMKDGLSIETRNKSGASPLMIAVDQTIPRTEVIQILVKRSQRFLFRDITGSTVFHHCLGSPHDDRTCAEILKIIIDSCNKKSWLSKDNYNGDTVLSIAAKNPKHSRIQSILILLDSCGCIVNMTNKDGLSPLHLAVRSLNNCSPSVELECCVRVVILICNGAETNTNSGGNVKVIDDCQYDCIRNILLNPKDEEIMKNELDCILDKLKNHKKTFIQSLNCFGKISEGLQKRVAQAISYLQNISFENVSSSNEQEMQT